MGLFTKLFGASDNENDNAQDLDYINKLLVHSKDEPLGISENNLIYIGYSELGGYYYLQTYIVGKLKVKTKIGAKLKIEGNNYSFSMNSDMDEFESDSADRFKGYVTQIDFEIEKEIVDKISRSTIKTIVLTLKNKELTFSKYEANTTEN